MDGQRVGWIEGTGGGVERAPLQQVQGRGQMASLSGQSESQFSPAPHGKNPPSSHMQPDKRPWNACATPQQDAGCLSRGVRGSQGIVKRVRRKVI